MPLANAPPAVCIALHDVSPVTWSACTRLLAMIDRLGPIPVTLLVVPDYHRRARIDRDPAFLRAIEKRLARGDEVALHGYYHRDDVAAVAGAGDVLRRRIYTAGEGEFAAIGATEAAARLQRGIELWRTLGWPVQGFVAPAWLLSAGARAALTTLPFTYTTTLRALHRLPDWQRHVAPCLVYSVRSGARRHISRRWNEWLLARNRRSSTPLRLGLHPADARHPEVVQHWRSLIMAALRERQPLTKQAWLRVSGGSAAALP